MHDLILFISMPGGTEWILILIGLPLYFIPTIIAAARHHHNTLGIFLLNFFLGWTFLGWLGSLIWAFTSKPTPTVIVNNSTQAFSQESRAENQVFSQQTQPDVSQKQATTQQDKVEQLRQFKQLLDEGIITIEEFNKQKAVILGL